MTRLSLLALTILGLMATEPVAGWGGLFNRYSPAVFGDVDKANAYANELFSAAERHAPFQSGSVGCSGSRCTSNEQCCEHHVCVDREDAGRAISFGVCMAIFGRGEDEECDADHDCNADLVCVNHNNKLVCKRPPQGHLALGETCRVSSDCMTHRGLCCKLQRRAHGQPKKICTYYTDPKTCLGHVSHSESALLMEHTAGEKRISSHPDFHFISEE